MTISDIRAYQILDSRGEPTVLVRMFSDTGREVTFAAPTGVSKGLGEAVERRDTNNPDSFRGQGVAEAVDLVQNHVAHKFIGYPLGNQTDFDSLLVALDGTPTKERLGSNTVVALSGAYLKLSALELGKEVWQYVSELMQTTPAMPRIFANLFNGGQHAPGLGIQEFMVVPKSSKPLEAITQIYNMYHTIRPIMENLYGASALLVGLEGGMAPIGATTEVVLEALSQLNGKMQNSFDIAVDCAANSLYENGSYNLDGGQYTTQKLLETYASWQAKFNVTSFEDPFAETDPDGMTVFKAPRPFLTVGDDLTVSNRSKIEEFAQAKIVDAVIIKPNQIGTMSETLAAVNAANKAKLKIIVSNRAGETNDDLIVDLAVGLGAMGIKVGAPNRGERVAKYNRLLQIERDYPDIAADSQPLKGASTIPTDGTLKPRRSE
ncbi:hypothetical protein IT414_01890 [bacterium]|nr:hypothetical protein [bacterium]